MRTHTLLAAVFALTSASLCLFEREASAQMIIKNPGDHPKSWELEPHLIFRGALLPEGDPGFGLGFRATIPIVENGFISKINNSVGIGLGLDWLTYRGAGLNHFVAPVVMQWNFFLSKSWSVFAEPGIALNLFTESCDDYHRLDNGRYLGRSCNRRLIEPHIGLGGRWHFKRDMTLTLRAANNYVGVGISWFLSDNAARGLRSPSRSARRISRFRK